MVEGCGVAVREARADDAALLAEVGARTFRDTFAADNTPEDMAAYLRDAFSPDLQAAELAQQGSVFFLAEVEGAAAGYARMRTGPTPACVTGARPIEIVRLYADVPWLGRGVGAALMAACLRHAAGSACDTVWLDVWERNPRAITFYRRWGFETVGEQAFVLGDDVQHDLIMARPVTVE